MESFNEHLALIVVPKYILGLVVLACVLYLCIASAARYIIAKARVGNLYALEAHLLKKQLVQSLEE